MVHRPLFLEVYDATCADQHGVLELGSYAFVVTTDTIFANGMELPEIGARVAIASDVPYVA
jgi:hypothetical protein